MANVSLTRPFPGCTYDTGKDNEEVASAALHNAHAMIHQQKPTSHPASESIKQTPPDKEKETPTNGMINEALTLHFSHAAGGSILLLPYALSQVGLPGFLFFLFVHACFIGIFQRIVCDLATKYKGKDNGNFDAKWFFRIVGDAAEWLEKLLKVLFVLDIYCCITFYFLLFEEISTKLPLFDEYNIREQWIRKALASVILSLLLLLGVVSCNYFLKKERKRESNGHTNQERPSVLYIFVTFG